MGLCTSKSTAMTGGTALEKEVSSAIDSANEQDFEKESEKIKLLLLGAGESGKSTVLKQMRLLYGDDYTEEELIYFRLCIHHNVVDFMENLCKAVVEFYPDSPVMETDEFQLICPADTKEGSNHYRQFPELTSDYVQSIQFLWEHEIFQQCYSRRAEFQLIEMTAPFISRIEEVTAEGYRPSTQDVLLCRLRTTGMKEERLNIDGQIFCFFDVGGQRNERKKWIRLFENVHGVIFMAALSEFNQTLWEVRDINRMTEALSVFEKTVNEEAFDRSAFILFLNKSDIFLEKIKTINLKEVPGYSDYKGQPFSFADGVAYFKDKFVKCNTTHEKIYCHVTCATDTSSVSVVFNACKEMIVSRSLQYFGFCS